MSDLELHIYGGEGTRENSMYCTCTHSMRRRSHESWNPCANTFLLPDRMLPLGATATPWQRSPLSDLVARLIPRHRVVMYACRGTHGARNWSPLTPTGDVNTVSSVPRRGRTARPESEQPHGRTDRTVAHFRRGRRAALPLAVASAASNAACSQAGSDRPTDGWGRPRSARDLDAKLASFVSERGSINTGHVPLPLAVGAAAGALTGGVPHPRPRWGSVSSPVLQRGHGPSRPGLLAVIFPER